jgi:NitT/TauT family transport system substrate-binding protein
MDRSKTVTSGLPRRKVLTGAALALGVATGAIPRKVFAQSAKKVRFTLPWLAGGSNLYVYVAQNKGYWKKRGLDVEVSRGYGSVAASQAIGTGKFDFGIAAAGAGIQQVSKGLPIAMLGCVHYDSTMGICVLDDSPIKGPKDLEGRKLGSAVASGEYPFLPAFAQNAGFDLKKVEQISLDPKIRQRALIQKQVDAISSFAGASVPSIVVQGHKTRFMAYKDYGLPFYGLGVMTQPKMLSAEPALCQAIVEGVMEGVALMLADPEAALAAFLAEVKEMKLTPTGAKQVEIGMGMFGLAVAGRHAENDRPDHEVCCRQRCEATGCRQSLLEQVRRKDQAEQECLGVCECKLREVQAISLDNL